MHPSAGFILGEPDALAKGPLNRPDFFVAKRSVAEDASRNSTYEYSKRKTFVGKE